MTDLTLHQLTESLGSGTLVVRKSEAVEGVLQRRERVSELVRERRQKFVLAAVALAELVDELGPLLVEPRAVERRGGVRGQAPDDAFGTLREDAALGMAEEEPSGHLAHARHDGQREVTAHRQMTLRHAEMRAHR